MNLHRSLSILTTIWLALLIPCTAGEIHDAVLKHDLAAVDRILKSKPSQINARLFPDCKTPLRLAIDIADPAIVKRLLAAKADLTIPDADGMQPLVRAAFIASDDSHVPAVSLSAVLLGAGVDFCTLGIANIRQPIPKPPAAERDARLAVLKLLLATKPELNTGFSKDVTPLHVAVRANDPDAVGLILKAGGKADVEDALWNTPLHYAALRAADPVVLNLLMDQGAKVEATNKAGYNALIYAQVPGRNQTIEALIAHGARMDAEDFHSVPIIAHAAAFGHDEVVRMLYAKGGRGLIRHSDPSELFQGAARGGSRALAEILLSEGIDVNVRDRNGFTPLLTAVEWDRREIVRFLMEKGADRGARTSAGKGLFYFACMAGNATLVKEMLDAGIKADHNSVVESAASGRLEIVELLLARGADVNSTNEWGDTPLDAAISGRYHYVESSVRNKVSSSPIASEDDYARIVELLLDRGAKIDVVDKSRNTPMDDAAKHCGPRVMKALLKAGGNPSPPPAGPYKATPLLYAAGSGQGATLRILLDAGAQPSERSDDGLSLLSGAAGSGNADAMKIMLLDERFPLEAKSPNSGATALHMAAMGNSLDCVRLLLAAGANPNSLDRNGATPLLLAVARQTSIRKAESQPEELRVDATHKAQDLRSRLSIIQLLIEYGAKTDVFPNTYKSLADFAKDNGTPEIVELLLNPPPVTKKPSKP